MCKKIQRASRRLRTSQQIADALLSGSHEIIQFPELFHSIPAPTKRVLQNVIDRVRPLEMKVRQLECQIEHLKNRVNEPEVV